MGDEISIMTKLNTLTDAKLPLNDIPRSEAIAALAFGAVLNGPASIEWKNYMKEIVGNDSPKQLARLTLKEDKTKNDPKVRRSAAYIVANGMCTPETTMRTNIRVDPVAIDQSFDV